MATSSAVRRHPKLPPLPATELPTREPSPPDKTLLARYLMAGARELLDPADISDPETLPAALHAATRRLAAANYLLKGASGNHPSHDPSARDWPQRARPTNQAAFHEWVLATFLRVFRLERQPQGAFIPVEAPSVKGLAVFATKCEDIRFYGAWTAVGGVFVGWMRVQPQVVGIDSDYAVGEVLGRPVFNSISIDLSGHAVMDRFVTALKEAAWDLGAADG